MARGKTVIRCGDCGVGSDKKIILVYHGIRKCQNCAAMQAMESMAAMKDVRIDSTPMMVSNDGS